MSDRQLPDAVRKRDILFGVHKSSTAELIKSAEAFEAEGWISDAIDFRNQAKDLEGLKRLRKEAVKEGDAFLFMKVSRLLDDANDPSVDALLLECAENAERLGKNRYAMKAYEKLGRTDKVEAIRSLVADDGDIQAEAASKVFIPVSEDEALDEEEN